jgi:hypothetical protein
MRYGSETCLASVSAVGSGKTRPTRPGRANPMAASGLRWCAIRAVLWLTVGSSGLFSDSGMARAQAQAGPARSAPAAVVPAVVATPGPTAPPSDRGQIVDPAEAQGVTASPGLFPELLPSGAGTEMGLLQGQRVLL